MHVFPVLTWPVVAHVPERDERQFRLRLVSLVRNLVLSRHDRTHGPDKVVVVEPHRVEVYRCVSVCLEGRGEREGGRERERERENERQQDNLESRGLNCILSLYGC